MNNTIDKPARAGRRAASDTTITMRVPGRTRDLIDTAAAALGKSRTELMLESARIYATNVLLDRFVFDLEEEQAEALAAIFAEPPAPVPELRALMASKAPWE